MNQISSYQLVLYIKLFTAVLKNVTNKLVLSPGRPYQHSIMHVGKARSLFLYSRPKRLVGEKHYSSLQSKRRALKSFQHCLMLVGKARSLLF
jgi:hypothetical protein